MIIRGNTVGTNMSVDKIAEKIGGAPLIVIGNPQETGILATKNSEEIYQHLCNGGIAYFQYASDGGIYQLSYADQWDAVFLGVRYGTPMEIKIDAEGNITEGTLPFATYEDIGDISSALDELHAYAQGLIDGDVNGEEGEEWGEPEESTPISPKTTPGGDTE